MNEPELVHLRRKYKVSDPVNPSYMNPPEYNQRIEAYLKKYYEEEGDKAYTTQYLEHNYERAGVEWKKDEDGNSYPDISYNLDKPKTYNGTRGSKGFLEAMRWNPLR